MQIRVTKDLVGVYQELQPEVGGIYTARPGKPLCGHAFCTIEIAGKYVVLREGEYEILRRDPQDDEKQPPLWRGKEKKVEEIKEALPAPEKPKEEKKPAPKKRGPKPKAKKPEDMLPEEKERALEQQNAELQKIVADLRLRLETKESETMLRQEIDELRRSIHDRYAELTVEQAARRKAERALLKLTLERYGGE